MTGNVDQARLAELARRWDGPFTYDDLLLTGIPLGTVRRTLATGRLVKLGRSAFYPADLWQRADPWEKFRLRSLGFALGSALVDHLTGWSAAVLLGLSGWGSPPRVVTAIRHHPTASGTNRSRFAHIRTGILPAAHRWDRVRFRLTGPAFTAIDVARHGNPEQALTAIEHVLRIGVPPEDLQLLVEKLHRYPGIRLAAWALDHCDPRTESALESLGRLAFLEAGREPPLSNVWIDTPEGSFRLDHLLPESGTVLEADGGLKLRDAEDPHAVMREQVIRESAIRNQGYAVERYDWSIATRNRQRILELADRGTRSQRGRPIPTDWTFDPPDRLRQWFVSTQKASRRAGAQLPLDRPTRWR